MSNKHHFKFDVDVNVINHLGVGLYSSTPAALTELVANAWDSDATEVHITIDPQGKSITIEDDGHGMTATDISKKFLNVGYSRRKNSTNKNFSNSGNRRVMGRKGIGKLAMFALANSVRVSSQAAGNEVVGFKVNVPELKRNLETNQTPELEEFSPGNFAKGHGTKIVLDDVLVGLKTTEGYLRVKLARRFSVIDDSKGFTVFLNKTKITKADRGFYPHVQFLWAFDQSTLDEISGLSKNLASVPKDDEPGSPLEKCAVLLPPVVGFGDQNFQVTGYVASVFQPKNLGNKDDSANMFSVFANGRVFAENILTEANSAKYYQNYLVGEIHANFLDDDDIDRATASREAIKRDDPKYNALIGFVRTTLESIGNQWDDWRTALGLDPTDGGNAGVNAWLETLTDRRDHAVAKRLMTSIKNATVHSDDEKNEAAKKVLYRGAIVGFEKLKLKKQLDKLANVNDVLSPEFASIFSSLNDVEEAAYADITKQRLEIIKKFKEIANDASALEKVAQEYLFQHLWLLDPTWDRVTGRGEMEVTLTKYLKEVQPDSTGARLDISYRASSGRHIVVELKKPGKTSLNYYDLFQQVSKYKDAIHAYYDKEEPNKPKPPLDIYLLVAQTPTGYDESKKQALAAVNGRIITYSQLINDATNAYQAYWDVTNHTGSLETILSKI
ncbi:BbrUII/HgiDII family restriction enzyme [Herbaspirillum sp. B65]|uniref:BbrUII/HgiDII family restriction enzyme n=2 Tax=Herbaspirillum sp. B65 TaxID=137708 RepID=UPI0003461367|nr:ATP-binding protein [Herbaspirillum sp. B65]